MGNTCCCVQVDESTVALAKRFGRFEGTLEPGCHFLPWVCGYQLAGKLSLQWQLLHVNCKIKTRDDEFVNVVASVQYRALPNRAYDAFYSLSNPRSHIQVQVIAVIGAMVAARNLDEVFQQQDVISQVVVKELQQDMFDYGYDIERVLIINIKLDERIEQAMIENNAAIKKAEIKRAEQMAEFMNVADGVRQSVLGFLESVPGASAKDAMDAVLKAKYLDTMKEIGASSKSDVVFIPPGAGVEVRIHSCEGLHQA